MIKLATFNEENCTKLIKQFILGYRRNTPLTIYSWNQ